jgi:hypothetical protein
MCRAMKSAPCKSSLNLTVTNPKPVSTAEIL